MVSHSTLLMIRFLVTVSSVQFSSSAVSNSLQPYQLQQSRLPCPSPTPRVHPNPCPLSWWCHPTISSSVAPCSFCPQSFPASGSLQMSQLFTLASGKLKFYYIVSVQFIHTIVYTLGDTSSSSYLTQMY